MRRTSLSLHLTGAFSLSALLLYAPANLLPILRMERYGAVTDNTVLKGCVRFYQAGDHAIAIIVFLASVAIPFLKLACLFFLVITSRLRYTRLRQTRTWMYLAIETLGRWAMLDVFVLAVLISLVKLQKMATISVGPGALAFMLVVIFTMLASQCFDPWLIWEEKS